MAVILLVFILFICQAESISNEIKVYQFNPDYNNDNFLSIQPKTPTSKTTGFSFCLRAIFWTWNYRVLVETGSITLGLQEPKQNFGFYKTNSDFLRFPLEIVNFSPTIWNSFCMSFNETDLLFKITINGQLVTTSKSSIRYELRKITIGSELPESRFYGQITDFNFWNKPLALTEMEEFSSGCNTSNFLLKQKPEYVLWPKANITLLGKSTTKYYMNAEMLCNVSPNNSVPDSLLLFGNSVPYEESVKVCDELKGEFVLQGNADKNVLQREEASLYRLCDNKFWVFTNILEENKNNQELISDGHSMKINNKCWYYDVFYQTHNLTVCKERNCFLCQIPERQLKYQFKSSKEKEFLETDYFLVNYNGQVTFLGQEGLNYIQYFSDQKYSILYFNYSEYVHIGYLHGKTIFPIGLQTLTLYNNGESFQVKITDVSKLKENKFSYLFY
jgi:hypothetical protein